MATPTIEAIATQDITIDTDYELGIGITGDPEEVTVGGIITGFYYDWDASVDTLTIAGNAERLIADVVWTVNAKETPSSTAVTREITYSVVPAAPIIADIGEFDVPQQEGFSHQIDIANTPTTLKVNGLILGWKYDPNEDGVEVYGDLPEDANFTVDSGEIEVIAENDGGMDTVIGTYNIVEARALYVSGERVGSATLNRVGAIAKILTNFEDGATLEANEFIYGNGNNEIGVSDGYIYEKSGTEMLVYPGNVPPQKSIRIKEHGLQNIFLPVIGIDFYNDDLYYLQWQSAFYASGFNEMTLERISADFSHDVSQTIQSTLEYDPVSTSIRFDALAIIGENIYIAEQENRPDEIYVFPRTSQDSSVSESLIIELPLLSGESSHPNILGLSADGDNLYILTPSDVRIINPTNVGNNQIATLIRSFNLPSDYEDSSGMHIQGNNLYIAKTNVDVGIFDKNTINGTTASVTGKILGLGVRVYMTGDANYLYSSVNGPLGSSVTDLIATSYDAQARVFDIGSTGDKISVEGTEIFNLSGTTLSVYDGDTSEGATAAAIRTHTLTSTQSNLTGFKVTSDKIYTMSSSGTSTTKIIRTYTRNDTPSSTMASDSSVTVSLPGSVNPLSFTFIGGKFYVLQRIHSLSTSNWYLHEIDPADGTILKTGTIDRDDYFHDVGAISGTG